MTGGANQPGQIPSADIDNREGRCQARSGFAGKEMEREAEPRLHGATDGEGDLVQGGEEDGMRVGSSPRRQEEDARVSSSRSPSAVSGDASFRSSSAWSSSSFSSLASDVESDAAYPWTQCEYEEIPSFRWIASPLRWWKPKKGSDLSRKNTSHAPPAIRDKEPGTPGGSSASETSARLVHFKGYRRFTLDELLSAEGEVLGKNIYWSTYKATLDDGCRVAVWRLRSEVTAEDFVPQVNRIGKIRHSNLLAPRAYYYSPNPNGETLLMFDYMPKRSLSDFLHAGGNSTPIDWLTRMNIAIGVARGLHHLHTQGNIIHGNLSSANVLLDYHVNAKIGGYGLSKLLNPAAANSNFLEITWTSGYRAAELSNLNKANTKTDVYSLGVIMLELLTGKSPTGFSDKTQWVESITKVETAAQPEFRDTLKLALKCVDASPDVRPEMQNVLQQLEEIKSKFEKTTHSTTPTTEGGNKPAASTITTTSPAVEISASDAEAMPAPMNSYKHKDENLATMMPQGDLKDSVISNPSQAEEVTQNPFVNEELDALNPAEDRTGVRMDMERCNAMSSQGTGGSPLSGIDWATVDIQVRLHVPTSPPLISSDPDSGYRRYFRTLYELAHRSPPLPCDVLEVQLNSMIMGLHSLGYPLDTWVKAANLLLVLAKKQEYIEQHVGDYTVHVEMQLKEFTSAITPAKEEITGTQSEITVLEQKQEELDETIAKSEDQLALLKTQRLEVANSLTTAKDVLAVAEAKVESIFVRMNCLNQQCSAISNQRRAMLLELPSLDEVFDSTFQEIMTKTF